MLSEGILEREGRPSAYPTPVIVIVDQDCKTIIIEACEQSRVHPKLPSKEGECGSSCGARRCELMTSKLGERAKRIGRHGWRLGHEGADTLAAHDVAIVLEQAEHVMESSQRNTMSAGKLSLTVDELACSELTAVDGALEGKVDPGLLRSEACSGSAFHRVPHLFL